MTPKTSQLLWIIRHMIEQNCSEDSPGVFHSGFIGIHAVAMDALVGAGHAEYIDGPGYGRGRAVRFVDEQAETP